MPLSTICRLCFKTCHDFKSLYHKNGRATELYEMAFEFFHPKIVDLEVSQHLNTVCLACVVHLEDFYQFQKSIIEAQSRNLQKEDLQEVAIKTETEEGISEDLQHAEALSSFLVCSVDENTGNAIKTEVVEETISEEIQQPEGTGDRLKIADPISLEHLQCPKVEVTSTPMSDEEIIIPNEITSVQLESWLKDSDMTPATLVGDTTNLSMTSKLEIVDVQDGQSEYSSVDEEADCVSISDDDATLESSLKPQCSTCGKSFTHKSYYIHHMKRRHGIDADGGLKVHCDLCNSSFASRNGLRGHMKVRHPKDVAAADIDFDFDEATQKFICKICGNTYRLKVRLVQHMRKLHRRSNNRNRPSETPASVCEVFKCKYCDHACICKDAIRRHMEKHHGVTAHTFEYDYDETTKQFKCKLCENAFSYRHSLQEHMEHEHWQQHEVVSQKLEYDYDRPNRAFKCKLCTTTHVNINLLVMHMTRFHWKTEQESQPETQPKMNSKCEICKNRFPTKEELAQHYTQVHCNSGLHPCTKCGKKFNEVTYLHQHQRNVHSTEPKGHKCDTCGKAFRLASELRRHQVSHREYKGFSCALCSAQFKHARNRVQHMKKVHPQALKESST